MPLPLRAAQKDIEELETKLARARELAKELVSALGG